MQLRDANLPGPRTAYVAANGLNFAVLEWGPADGPLALCLHGFPDTPWTWRHLGPDLAEQGYRVVAPYLRGYAPTGLAPDGRYDLAVLTADTLALHKALGGDERAVLIGHDWGAAIAYAAAGPFARTVTMAVPPGGVLLGQRDPLFAVKQLRLSWYMLFNQLPRLPETVLPRLVRRLWADWSPGYDASEDLPYVDTALALPAHASAAIDYYRHTLRGLRKPDIAAALNVAPRAPHLFLMGEHDGCIRPQFAALTQAGAPVGVHAEVVPGVGHFMQLEDPGAINARISAFLSA